jgi:predicted Zn-dependent protease with MMP-like domain
MSYCVGKEEFEEMVQEAIDLLPPEFAAALEEVSIQIVDQPTPRQLKSVNVEQGNLLLGLYQGRPRTQRSVQDTGYLPDAIFLFKEHIEAASRSSDELMSQVRKTVLHEVGHHFGLNEDDLTRLGYG